jgi:lysophospholipase L1-like esterase
MNRTRFVLFPAALVAVVLVASPAAAQTNFEKDAYYLSMGDSVGAGQGALPVTNGFAYQLYEQGVFGRVQETDFSNIAIKGATAEEVLALQVPQALCIQPPRITAHPSVVTLTAGAADFFVWLSTSGIPPDPATQVPAIADAIAARVAAVVRALVFGQSGLPATCAAGIPGITVLVSNYYSFDHPVAEIEFLLDLGLQAFSASLQARLAVIDAEIQASGKDAAVGFVDTFSAMEGRRGLLLIERRNGFTSPFDFEIHPTNAGHSAIAAEFERVWDSMQ